MTCLLTKEQKGGSSLTRIRPRDRHSKNQPSTGATIHARRQRGKKIERAASQRTIVLLVLDGSSSFSV